MAAADNAELIRGLFEAVNRRELGNLGDYIAPEFERHDLVGAYPGVDADSVVDFLSEVIRSVPDMQLNIDDVLSDGDRVAVRFKLEGTLEGELFGQSGSGKPISVNAINIYRVADGKVAETWQLQDLSGFSAQIAD
jgi:steroid delta-isomerase-like uncharacterized protein